MLRISSKLFVRLLLMLSISLALAMAPGTAYAAKTIYIGDARALPLGSTVTTKGTVTVASGPLGQAPLTRALPCKTRVAASM